MFRIVYEKHESGNFHVTLHSISQTITLRPGFFKRIVEVKGDVILGCTDVTAMQLSDLGFVIPSFWTKQTI